MEIQLRLASAMKLARMHAYCVIHSNTGNSHLLSYGNDGVYWEKGTKQDVLNKLLKTDAGVKCRYIGVYPQPMDDLIIEDRIEEFLKFWSVDKYNVLTNNCWNFSLDLIRFFSLR